MLFPETVAVREVPTFTWGAIFADREAARFRRVVRAAAETTRLALPPDAARLLDDQRLAEETFVLWDLVHDRTHMRGDLPFDPFMIKQRMPYFLYSLEELRCDLTAFRAAVRLEGEGVPHARYVQYAILFDRLFRFPVTGSRACATTTGSAVSCCSPGCTSTTSCTGRTRASPSTGRRCPTP